SLICYFFQAEDGIRDRNVTGVQTCALPIYQVDVRGHEEDAISEYRGAAVRPRLLCLRVPILPYLPARTGIERIDHVRVGDVHDQIGRASCRGRVKSTVWSGGRNKKQQVDDR